MRTARLALLLLAEPAFARRQPRLNRFEINDSSLQRLQAQGGGKR